MRISLELFLIDNMIMNLLILRLGCVFSNARFRLLRALPFAVIGAVYAVLSLSAAPVLNRLIPKIALGAAMSVPLLCRGRSFFRALISLYLAAFITGGMMLALTVFLGGTMQNGALIGTTPVRLALLSACLCCLLPRCMRELIALCRARERFVPLRIRLSDRVLSLRALVDSGNLLTEPVSGKAVILIQPHLLPEGGRPVPFATIQGSGMLFAQNALCIEAHFGIWTELDAMIAEAPENMLAADAILPETLLEKKRRPNDVSKNAGSLDAVVPSVADAKEECGLLYFLRRNIARAFSDRRGAHVD